MVAAGEPRRPGPDRGAARDRADGGRPPDRCDDEPRRSGRSSGHPRHAGRPSPTRPRSSARRRRGTSGRSAATSPTRRRPPRRAGRCSASRPRCEVRSTAGDRRIALADLFSGPGRTTIHPDELIVAVVLPELDGAGSCYVRLEFRRQMEIAVVGATAVVQPRGRASSATPGSPSPRSPRRSGGSPSPRPRSSGRMAGRRPPRRRAGSRPRPATPISDVRSSLEYRRAMAAVVVRRAVTGAIARARGETIADPCQRQHRSEPLTMRYPVTLQVNETRLPGGDRGRPDAAVRAARRARPDRHARRAATTPSAAPAWS